MNMNMKTVLTIISDASFATLNIMFIKTTIILMKVVN